MPLQSEEGLRIPDRHHYVPQFLLRNFRSGKRPQVHVFDKHTDATFHAGVTKVAAAKGFYDSPALPEADVEQALSHLETAAASAIAKIVSSSRLRSIDQDDRVAIALFSAAQMVRVPVWRQNIRDVNEILRQSVIDMGADPDTAGLKAIREEDLGNETLLWLHSVPDLAQHFLAKDWAIFRAPTPSFYISDNPVTLDTAVPRDPFRGLGIGSEGVELYLPLTSSLTLGMMCPSIRLKAQESLAAFQACRGLPSDVIEAVRRVSRFTEDLSTGATINIEPANVERLNSLQVRTSARFVYSGMANFDLVRLMLAENPDLRSGVRIERS